MDTTNRWALIGLGLWLFTCFIAAALGAAASAQASVLYDQLLSPGWAPPAWLFAPVWTVLYTMMAFAAWMVWRVGGLAQHRSLLILFVAQLMLNSLWSWLFFGWQRGELAFANIIALWLMIVVILEGFRRVRPLAAALMVPYLLWVSFAAVLNFTVWQLNPGLLG